MYAACMRSELHGQQPERGHAPPHPSTTKGIREINDAVHYNQGQQRTMVAVYIYAGIATGACDPSLTID
jgi:hypothetical protein